MAKKRNKRVNDGNILFGTEAQPSEESNAATEKPKEKSFLSGFGRGERIAAIGVCFLLVVGALGAGLGEKIASVFTTRILNQKTSQSQSAQNALMPTSLNPATTTQLSKEYIYAGSRMLAIEDAGSAPPPSRVNVALASNGATASASSMTTDLQGWSFLPSSANNGDRRGINETQNGYWRDGTGSAFPDWLEIEFSGAKSINEIDVFTVQDNSTNPSEPTETMTFSSYGITNFEVQYQSGTGWTPVPGGTVSGNNNVWRKFTFEPITTTKIRVWVNNAADSRSRIVEVEAWSGA